MKEKINFTELEVSLNNIKNLVDKMNHDLTSINTTINEHINSGEGILDGNSGVIFKNKWDEISKDIPTVIGFLKDQQTNLENLINNMKEQNQ